MASERNPRMDTRRSSTYCSTTTLVVFVALCLVGVWMITSSTITPLDLFSSENKSDVKEQTSGTDSKTFEDGLGDVEDNMRDDTNTKTGTYVNEPNKENLTDENLVKVNEERLNESDDTSKIKTDSDNQEVNQDNIKEKDSEETIKDEQGKSTDQNFAEQENNEQTKISENSSNETGADEQQQFDNENTNGNPVKDNGMNEVFPDGAQTELLNETGTQNSSWLTQVSESKNEKELQASSSSKGQMVEYSWKLCNVAAGADYIPCLDNEQAIKKLPSTKHYEHRERHCPEEGPTCLVGYPDGYRQPIQWPFSRDKVWYKNVPHTKLVAYKGHQNWVKVSGEYLTFPGGGTQFKNGALHYIDTIQETLPDLAWGKRSRVVLDVGCGVASFGGYLFERDVLTMSFAPKDEHEAQVQFALERGIPALSAVMGTKRLPFPSRVFDVVHCARCRVPWHIEGGMLLLELNRLLRPGGYFVWSATPVYRKTEEDVGIWNAMTALTKSMCWKVVAKSKDQLNQVGFAIYRKPSDNKCYERRKENSPPLCHESDDPNAAWNVPLQACMHKVPVDPLMRGSQWPEQWSLRLEKTPYWLISSQIGVYGKPAPEDFQADYEHWKHVVSKSYLNGMGINWSSVRNVMDMSSVYGGFAAALRDMKVWVMNIVAVDSPDTLPIIYERGLFGMYHDWCESFSTYPRSYDLLHADHLFSKLKKRCKLLPVIAEVDRILRLDGKLIVRDNAETIGEIESMAKSLHWNIRFTYSKDNEALLCVQKTMWRPEELESST